MEIISRREHKTHTERFRAFSWKDEPGAGFLFPCDDKGNPIVTEGSRENIELCLSGDPRLVDEGVQEYTHSWVEPSVGRCHCGREVVLDHFTNTCDCGTDYNSAGQRLAPREQWGEETGESLGDILRIS